jgi:hypothetical protein
MSQRIAARELPSDATTSNVVGVNMGKCAKCDRSAGLFSSMCADCRDAEQAEEKRRAKEAAERQRRDDEAQAQRKRDAEQFVHRLRTETGYPSYRSLVETVFAISLLVTLGGALALLFVGLSISSPIIWILAVASGVVACCILTALKELALVLVDIADTVAIEYRDARAEARSTSITSAPDAAIQS